MFFYSHCFFWNLVITKASDLEGATPFQIFLHRTAMPKQPEELHLGINKIMLTPPFFWD